MEQAVTAGDTVGIRYTGKLGDGTVFDATQGEEAFTFTAGSDEVIEGIRDAVVGMQIGQNKTLVLPPDEAYGPREEELVIAVPADRLPEGTEVGDVLGDGEDPNRRWLVRGMENESVTLDANHPLAGETLTFDIELVSIGTG
ncbi:MAG: peptidylprolyl isomerase [Leptospirillia bacterium]